MLGYDTSVNRRIISSRCQWIQDFKTVCGGGLRKRRPESEKWLLQELGRKKSVEDGRSIMCGSGRLSSTPSLRVLESFRCLAYTLKGQATFVSGTLAAVVQNFGS